MARKGELVKKTLTFYEYTTVCHKYVVDVDVPDGTDLEEWIREQDETDGLGEIYGNVIPKEVSNEVEGMEVWDSESGQLLLQY